MLNVQGCAGQSRDGACSCQLDTKARAAWESAPAELLDHCGALRGRQVVCPHARLALLRYTPLPSHLPVLPPMPLLSCMR